MLFDASILGFKKKKSQKGRFSNEISVYSPYTTFAIQTMISQRVYVRLFRSGFHLSLLRLKNLRLY